MKFKLIPESNKLLESNQKWRLFKVVYFILGSISTGSIYSLINSWYYTNCPIASFKNGDFSSVGCVKLFAWDELLGAIVVTLIILRIIFPLVEKLTLYIINNEK
jgi:hypothetical protein